MVATVLEVGTDGQVSDARVAVGACSPVAQRLVQLENDLRGVRVKDLVQVPERSHLAPLAPIDDVRATASYRMDATLALIRRSFRRYAEST
jgi:CO/xanthine dehydrogenase FAD-binding subunit